LIQQDDASRRWTRRRQPSSLEIIIINLFHHFNAVKQKQQQAPLLSAIIESEHKNMVHSNPHVCLGRLDGSIEFRISLGGFKQQIKDSPRVLE
jgi:hypothetical protein